MKIYFTCLYCGHEWEKLSFSDSIKPRKCPICRDKRVKAKENKYLDFYEGCPPFPITSTPTLNSTDKVENKDESDPYDDMYYWGND